MVTIGGIGLSGMNTGILSGSWLSVMVILSWESLADKAQRGSFGEIGHERYCHSFRMPHPLEVGFFPCVACLYHNIHVSFNMKLRKCIDPLSIDPVLFVF